MEIVKSFTARVSMVAPPEVHVRIEGNRLTVSCTLDRETSAVGQVQNFLNQLASEAARVEHP